MSIDHQFYIHVFFFQLRAELGKARFCWLAWYTPINEKNIAYLFYTFTNTHFSSASFFLKMLMDRRKTMKFSFFHFYYFFSWEKKEGENELGNGVKRIRTLENNWKRLQNEASYTIFWAKAQLNVGSPINFFFRSEDHL